MPTAKQIKNVIKDSTKHTVKDTSGYTTDGVTITARQRAYSAATDYTFSPLQDLRLLPQFGAEYFADCAGTCHCTARRQRESRADIPPRFDCDHGTDINISVDGAPVNMVSHGHGQGYADISSLSRKLSKAWRLSEKGRILLPTAI